MSKLLIIPIVGAIIIISMLTVGAMFMIVPEGGTAYAGDTAYYKFVLTNLYPEALPKPRFDSDGDGIEDTQIRLYKAYRLTDTAGNIVVTGCKNPDGSIECDYVKEVCGLTDQGDLVGQCQLATGATTSVEMNFSITEATPSTYDGSPYGASGTLFKVTEVWDRNTNNWTQTPSSVNSVDNPDCSGFLTQVDCEGSNVSAGNSCYWTGTECKTNLAYKFYVSTQEKPPAITPVVVYNWFNTVWQSFWVFLQTLFGFA